MPDGSRQVMTFRQVSKKLHHELEMFCFKNWLKAIQIVYAYTVITLCSFHLEGSCD
jgi:hypothetical protein